MIFLCSFLAVPPFKSDLISEPVLQRLIRQNIVVNFRLADPASLDCYLYRVGKPCDYFIMIVQGRVNVEFGKENLVFEGGPFVFFGVQALSKTLSFLLCNDKFMNLFKSLFIKTI
jgi:metal transporter CNNM